MNCPSPVDLLLARIAGGTAEPTFRGHLRACPKCRQAWEALAGAEEAAALATLPGPPGRLLEGTLQSLLSLVPPRRRRAGIVFDPARMAPAAVLRGHGTALRHLTLRAEPWELELALLREPDTGRAALLGQLFDGQGAEAAAAGRPEGFCVLSGPGGVRQVPLRADGSFRFGDVGHGRHDLLLDVGAEQILASDLDLPARDDDEACA